MGVGVLVGIDFGPHYWQRARSPRWASGWPGPSASCGCGCGCGRGCLQLPEHLKLAVVEPVIAIDVRKSQKVLCNVLWVVFRVLDVLELYFVLLEVLHKHAKLIELHQLVATGGIQLAGIGEGHGQPLEGILGRRVPRQVCGDHLGDFRIAGIHARHACTAAKAV